MYKLLISASTSHEELTGPSELPLQQVQVLAKASASAGWKSLRAKRRAEIRVNLTSGTVRAKPRHWFGTE